MRLFLPENVWKENRGFGFGRPASYLTIGFHGGQDFYARPIGTVPVFAPTDGVLTTFPGFSASAGWWGVFEFVHEGAVYSLKILHMYRQLRAGTYKEGDVLGYCGGTGLAVTAKYGTSYIGPSDAEQNSDRAVPHLHAELHKGKYKHDTNLSAALARQRLLDPVETFEAWIREESHNRMTFYKEKGKSAVYIKGANGAHYPIITGRHFIALFGDWSENTIVEVDELPNKSSAYFGLFRSEGDGTYDVA